MVCGVIKWSTMVTILIIIPFVKSEQQVPCYFIMGDSLVDSGNNNELNTTAKANFPPYGIDFPDGPTGRFTNGRNTVDFIAEYLGFDNYIPPFATAKGQEIIKGVNYGSGGAGILDESGRQLGDVISLNRQLLNHQITVSRMGVLLGSKNAAKEYLSKCLYTVGMGNNDYINNYLLPQYYSTSLLYTPDEYAAILIRQYSQQLKTLYKLGARKIAIFAAGEIGCTPGEIEIYGTNGLPCVESINNEVKLFNNKLKPLVDYLNNNLSDAKFTYLNFTITSAEESSNGIKILDEPCYKVSTNLGKGQSISDDNQDVCSNRSEYIFWDNYHPTEIFNQITASRVYTDISLLVQPFDSDKNVSTLEFDLRSTI